MDLDKVKALLDKRGEPAFRLKQIANAVYGDAVRSYKQISSLPAVLRTELEKEAPILCLRQSRLRVSLDGRAHKTLLTLADGLVIESVLLKTKPGEPWTVCISVQVGCAMGCTFCATGLMGLSRSLSPEEITDQVLFWKQYLADRRLPGRLTNVVYMGMGEPFHCYDNVAESLRILMDPARFGLSARHLSVSTVGLAQGIERFVEDFPQVNLALSLHAADDILRSKLVPANRAYPLAKLAESLRRALERNKRKIFLEYVLLDRENDAPEHAKELAKFVHSVGRSDLLHVNLIVWNPTDTPHKPSKVEIAGKFRDLLRERGIQVTIRRNLGTDIQGACGQLIAREPKK